MSFREVLRATGPFTTGVLASNQEQETGVAVLQGPSAGKDCRLSDLTLFCSKDPEQSRLTRKHVSSRLTFFPWPLPARRLDPSRKLRWANLHWLCVIQDVALQHGITLH